MAADIENAPTTPIARTGETVEFGGNLMTFLAVGSDTGGAYSVAHYVAQPGSGAPLHLHRNEVESFYILEGAMTFTLGGEKIRAAANECVTIPRLAPHAFANVEATPARMLVILTPAGLEHYFAELSALFHQQNGPTKEQIDSLNDKYNLDFSLGQPGK
ncbi:MAG: cupin domain-containing protein [Chloroflexota bacterium]|nr:cupin domain-containing protein [Chloroflexota bacterium]MDQ5865485.1 cupin domain-containing protein [Chloroflexota bacterium]